MKLCCFVGRPHNRTRDSKISMNHSYTLQSTFHYAKIFRKVGKSINRTLCSNKIFPFLSDGTGEKTANCAIFKHSLFLSGSLTSLGQKFFFNQNTFIII